MSLRYVCDGVGCTVFVAMTRRGVMPTGWQRARGWIAPDDRTARQGGRPVMHLCPACIARRDEARTTLGRKRLRLP